MALCAFRSPGGTSSVANTITAMGWRELPRHRSFRAAVERNAAWICALHDPLEPRARWLFNDSGRAPIITRIFFRLTLTGRATAADLIAAARRRGTPSAGRVLQVIDRAQAAGLLAVEADEGKPKRQQRLFVLPRLVEIYRGRAVAEIETAAMIAPDIAAAGALAQRDPFLFAFLAAFARVDAAGVAWRGPLNPAIRLFLQAVAVMSMVYDLMARQDPARQRLLEEAPHSRRALAKRFHVSRSHVDQLFAGAREAGWLSFPAADRVVFSPEMSQQAERHFATTFFAVIQSTRAALAAWPQGADQGPSRRLASGA